MAIAIIYYQIEMAEGYLKFFWQTNKIDLFVTIRTKVNIKNLVKAKLKIEKSYFVLREP